MAKRYAQVRATPGSGGGASYPMGIGLDTTLLSTEVVLGSHYFDPTLFLGPSVKLRLVGFYASTDVASAAQVYLYDMGPGTGAFTPIRRAQIEIPFSSVGEVVKVDLALTLTATPGVDSNQIHTTARVYEARMFLAATDGSMAVSWAGFEVA